MKLTWLFACDSEEIFKDVEQIAKQECNLNRITTSTGISYPGGVEERIVTHHALADYFDAINIKVNETKSLTITWEIRSDIVAPVGFRSWWKNLIVGTVMAIEKSGGKAYVV